MEAVPRHGRPGRHAGAQGPRAGGGVLVGAALPAAQYRIPSPSDAEALLFNVAVSFDGYRALAPEGWQPPDELTPENVERMRRLLRDPDAYALMAVHEASPVGHVAWEPVEGLVHLRHLFVLEPWWGTGIAATLHDRAVRAMRERRHEVARLFTPESQARARRFYERRGWTPAGPAAVQDFGMPLIEYRLRLG